MNPIESVTDEDTVTEASSNVASDASSPRDEKATTSKIIKKYSFWIRINLAIEIFLKKALLSFLHNDGDKKDPTYTGLTKDPEKLYTKMVQFKTEKVWKSICLFTKQIMCYAFLRY